MTDDETLARLRARGFQALDWGSSKGGSMDHVVDRFGYDLVVGIDLSPDKNRMARQGGRVIIEADAVAVEVGEAVVEAGFLYHFLEHLPSMREAETVLAKACRASRHAVYVRQPMFGADERLLELGLRFSWSTWASHPNRMTTLDFHTVLRALRGQGVLRDFRIGYGHPVATTMAECILPLTADPEAAAYDQNLHDPKPDLPLTGVYREVCVAIALDDAFDFEAAGPRLDVDRWIYVSR